jgi:hypothetical protein
MDYGTVIDSQSMVDLRPWDRAAALGLERSS